MKSFSLLLASIVLSLSSGVVLSQHTEQPASSSKTTQLPYEIVITPNVRKSDLRNLLIQVEDDFYEKFNELNMDDYYDIVCYLYTPLASHIQKRSCEPVFTLLAKSESASETLFLLSLGQYSARFANPESSAQIRVQKKLSFDVLQEKLEEFNKTDLEFRSMGAALNEVKKRLESFGKD